MLSSYGARTYLFWVDFFIQQRYTYPCWVKIKAPRHAEPLSLFAQICVPAVLIEMPFHRKPGGLYGRFNLVLASISKPILIENIFYDFDRATLRPESETSLNELVKMLNDNPNVSIELGAHTDLKGSEQYNLRLSDRRARSVVDYLIKSGINPDRLQPKGYGESRPKVITKKLATQYPQFKEGDVLDEKYINGLSPEDQEIANQINRRTEFQVLSITWNLY